MGCGGSREAVTVRPLLYYWPGSPRCRAVLMTLTAANIKVDQVIVDMLKGEHKEERHKQVTIGNGLGMARRTGYIPAHLYRITTFACRTHTPSM